MDFKQLLDLICSDLYRYAGSFSLLLFFKFFFLQPGFKYSFYLRLGCFLRQHTFFKPLYWIVKVIHRHNTYKYGISIPLGTEIGAGFYMGHFGGIVVNERVRIGSNCNISHGVTIGQTNRGSRAGNPVIGEYVYVGPGAKIIGHVRVGNNVAIGANCVVVNDLPDHAVVVGIPGRVISFDGSAGYVNNIWGQTPADGRGR